MSRSSGAIITGGGGGATKTSQFFFDAGTAAWLNDATQRDVFTPVTFPAVDTGTLFLIRGSLQWLNNSAANQSLLVALIIGGATVGSYQSNVIAASANPHIVFFDFWLYIRFGQSPIGICNQAGQIRFSAAGNNSTGFLDSAAVSSDGVGGAFGPNVVTDGSGGAGYTMNVQAKMSTATATCSVSPFPTSCIKVIP